MLLEKLSCHSAWYYQEYHKLDLCMNKAGGTGTNKKSVPSSELKSNMYVIFLCGLKFGDGRKLQNVLTFSEVLICI